MDLWAELPGAADVLMGTGWRGQINLLDAAERAAYEAYLNRP